MIDEKRLVEQLNELKDKCWDRAKKENNINFARKQLDISQVIGIINIQPKIGGWIPCSERLPEEKGWYLVYAKNQRPFVAYFKGKTFPLNNHYHEIVAWMPLPEPYEEKENG